MGRPATMPTSVVGGLAEKQAIADFLAAAIAEPTALLIEGEPGIGKTTQWLAALQQARDRGYRVLSATPAAAESVHAYAGLADLLSDVEAAALSRLPRPQRLALDQMLSRADAVSDATDRRAVAGRGCSAPSNWHERWTTPPTGAEMKLPGTLAELVRARVGRFDTELRDALLAAACLAAPTVDLIAGALGADARQVAAQHFHSGARTHPLHGQLQRRQRRKDAAATTVREALVTFESLRTPLRAPSPAFTRSSGSARAPNWASA